MLEELIYGGKYWFIEANNTNSIDLLKQGFMYWSEHWNVSIVEVSIDLWK